VEVLQAVVDERRALEGRDAGRRSKDMMDNLLEVKDENGRKLTDEEIIDVLIMYLNAGHESSGHITMWATVFLQENPDIFMYLSEEHCFCSFFVQAC
jgi:ent-kaurenoic acid monooxygenase